jgi:hypothetical protein
LNSKRHSVSVNLIVFKFQTTGYIPDVGVRTSGEADGKLSGLDSEPEKQSSKLKKNVRVLD